MIPQSPAVRLFASGAVDTPEANGKGRVLIPGAEKTSLGSAAAGTEQPEETDRDLLSRLRARDGDAFRLLVERHLPSVLAVARRILRDDAEAEDVAQEALLKLWQSGASLEIGAGGARPWLRRVASNLCIDRIRSGRRTDVTDEVPDQPVSASQIETLAQSETAARVEVALKTLPERQRQALVLFHFEDMSQSEVGAILGVSDEAVESLLARARRTMRGLLRDEWRQLLPGEG